jgi:hypothetical protein
MQPADMMNMMGGAQPAMPMPEMKKDSANLTK